MIRLLIFLLLLAVLGIGAAWLAQHPGHITLTWLGWRIDTSASVLFAAAALLLAAWTIVAAILHMPKHAKQARQIRQYHRGLTALTHGVAALGASDPDAAHLHTKKAEKHLGKVPLTLLLSAQIAKIRGDEAMTRALLTQMLEHKETEYLAARSLSDAASKQLLLPQALSMARRAHALNPNDKAGITTVVSLHVRLKQWQEADLAIDQARRGGHLSRHDLKRLRGVTHVQHGIELLGEQRFDAALAAARAAVKDLPHFVPAITLLARSFAGAGQVKKALSVVTGAWKRKPHAELGAALRGIIAQQPKEDQAKLTDKFQAVYTQKLSETVWQCRACGHHAGEWSAHCPACHGFDTLA